MKSMNNKMKDVIRCLCGVAHTFIAIRELNSKFIKLKCVRNCQLLSFTLCYIYHRDCWYVSTYVVTPKKDLHQIVSTH